MCSGAFLSFAIILCLWFSCEIDAKTSESLKVSLPNGGGLIGRYLISKSGRGIRGFLGIPYAEPPVGLLRFKNPVPKKPWTGYIDARDDSTICLQINTFALSRVLEGKEDCLQLNVYAPLNPEKSNPLPVMVFIHGGAFHWGSGGRRFYGPDYILDHDVILVTGNYRLGIMGFLSTGTDDCPGNFGLRDQTEILKWVNENIGVFGGDPQRVTIFGESAGGASVTYHMASKRSKGLFQQAISQSGNYLSKWAFTTGEATAVRAVKLGQMLGCEFKKNEYSAFIECLRSKPAEDIGNLHPKFYEFEHNEDPVIPFPPVIESESSNAFITANDIKHPHGLSLPLIIGVTADEGAIRATVFDNPETLKEINDKLDEVLLISLYLNNHDKAINDEISKMVKEFYFNNQPITLEAHKKNLTNLYSDGWFNLGMNEFLKTRLVDNTNSAETFVYLFSHYGEASLPDILVFNQAKDVDFGVSHFDELMFLFPMLQENIYRSAPTALDEKIQQLLTSMWVHFAATGEPTLKSGVEWKNAKKFPIDYLRIGNKHKESEPLIAMEKELWDPVRAKFWQKLKNMKLSKDNKKNEL